MSERSYTLGSFAYVQAIIQSLPDHYAMSLTTRDMATIIDALAHTAEEGPSGCAERALDMLSSIGETVGIEGI